jgi:hypothetical protein
MIPEINTYTNKDKTWFCATYGNTTKHSTNEQEVRNWLEDQMLNAEHYAKLAELEQQATEMFLEKFK